MTDDRVYIVVDIETDGPMPGFFSMLSIGAVAMTVQNDIDSFYEKVLPLPGMATYEITTKWWEANPTIWAEATENARPAKQVMDEFCSWLKSIPGTLIFVSHPIAFDYPFVSWYLWQFCGLNPFTSPTGSPSTLDLSSYISGKFNADIKASTLKHLPSEFTEGAPAHTHKAIDDARGYGVLLRNVLKADALGTYKFK